MSYGYSQKPLSTYFTVNHIQSPENLLKCLKHQQLEPPPLLKEGGSRTFQKLSPLGGEGGWGTKNFTKKGDNPEKGGGGVDVEMGGCHFFVTLQFNCIYCVCWGKVNFPLLHFGSSVFSVNQARFSSKSIQYLF